MEKYVTPVYKKVDYTNKKIGSWLVLGPAKYIPTKTGGRYLWYCRCDCGKEKWNNTTAMLYGRSSMCLTCKNSSKNMSKENNGNWKGYGEIPGEVLHRIKGGATRRRKNNRKLQMEITCKDLDYLWKKQHGKCAYTQRSLTLLKDASLDRIDSSKGYLVDNIEWVHKDVNKAKMALSKEDFLQMVYEINDHTRNNKNAL